MAPPSSSRSTALVRTGELLEAHVGRQSAAGKIVEQSRAPDGAEEVAHGALAHGAPLPAVCRHLAAGLGALAAGRARLRAARERELRPRRGMLPPDQDVVARVLALVPETRLEARVEVVERQRFGVVGEAHAALEEPHGVLPVLPPSAEGLVEAARLEQESPRERRVSAREVHVRPDVTGLSLATE